MNENKEFLDFIFIFMDFQLNFLNFLLKASILSSAKVLSQEDSKFAEAILQGVKNDPCGSMYNSCIHR
jgi:hypothetical protein